MISPSDTLVADNTQCSSQTQSLDGLEDFLLWSNGDLAYYLRQRGQPYSGKHSSLAARALVACEQKLPIVTTVEKLKEELESEYRSILRVNSLDTDPYLIVDWKEDIKEWPCTDLGKIFSYIREKKAFSSDYLGQYKVRKAYSHFMSGFVDKILTKSVNSSLSLIKTYVMPSQRINDQKHHLWILVKKTGDVVAGFCSCTAGFCQCCNHIVAALYKINFANENGWTDPACTDELCKWNTSAKPMIKPMKIKDMDIREHNKENEVTKKKKDHAPLTYNEKRSYDPRPESDRQVCESRKVHFRESIRDILPASVINISYAPPENLDVPRSLTEIANSVRDNLPNGSQDDVTKYFSDQLSFNDDQIRELEKITRSQSASNIWWNQRIGRITASKFGEVHTKVSNINKKRAKGKKIMVNSLVVSIVQPEKLPNVASLNWGKNNESKAAEAFMKHEGQKHTSPKLLACGLHIYKPQPYIGATPDNIFTCSCCEGTCVEYKCPYSIRKEEISVSWKKTKYLELKDNELRLKREHDYYAQIQGQMAITGKKKTYFVVWTEKGSPFIEVIDYDREHWQKVQTSVMIFFKAFIRDVLLGFKTVFTCPVCSKSGLDHVDYDADRSIQCTKCLMRYHYKCVGRNDDISDVICEFCSDRDICDI